MNKYKKIIKKIIKNIKKERNKKKTSLLKNKKKFEFLIRNLKLK